ncbi:MAG: c-type cytochrome, partial [Planctomycetes bacterium]|nr:c-type cytochrome [Planctomycetota bacterium]
LTRSGGAHSLAPALQTEKPGPAAAKQLLRALFSTGRSDSVLLAALNRAIGASARPPDYSEALVKRLVSDASKQGDAKRGDVLFKSVSCVTCHKVSGVGGVVGPNLTAIGTTLSAKRIVEELLWPDRQIKEGYSVVQVLTDDGKIHQGYERRTKQSERSGDLVIQELTTQTLLTIKKQHIEARRITGSPMPKGLTAVLSRSQLLDLIRYLTELGKFK